jgi:hypothetical protein
VIQRAIETSRQLDCPTEPPSQLILSGELRRLLDHLATETILADDVQPHGGLPTRLTAALGRSGTELLPFGGSSPCLNRLSSGGSHGGLSSRSSRLIAAHERAGTGRGP